MKSLALVSSLLAAAYAAPQPIGEVIREVTAESMGELAPIDNPLQRSTVNGEKVLPRFAQTSPKDSAKRTTVKYGSYMVSSTKMLSTTKPAVGPCPMGDCYVTAMEATIRYPGGVEANVDTGAWLHHIALFGTGAGGASIWAAGNERPTLRLNGEKKYGLALTNFMLMIDLMTEEVKAKNLTLEITYENVKKMGTGYKPVTMYWLTIGEPYAKQGTYSFSTMPSMVSKAGPLLYAIGHMHDGGDNMSLSVSGKVVCKSVMHYNARAGYGSPVSGGSGASAGAAKSSAAKTTTSMAKGKDSSMAGHSHGRKTKRQHSHGGGNDGAEHISDPGACTDFGNVKVGDSMRGTAYYNAQKHKLMVHNGKAEKLMGNMRVYVGNN